MDFMFKGYMLERNPHTKALYKNWVSTHSHFGPPQALRFMPDHRVVLTFTHRPRCGGCRLLEEAFTELVDHYPNVMFVTEHTQLTAPQVHLFVDGVEEQSFWGARSATELRTLLDEHKID